MTNPIFVAIDTPDIGRARSLVDAVRPFVGGVKLGLEFFSANGPAGVSEIAGLDLPLFLDLKLHDIPNTVGKAVAALAPLRPAILTVHAAGGRAMMEAAKAAAPSKTKVVAVTMLTSLEEPDLVEMGLLKSDLGDQWNFVSKLAGVARNAGIDGIVCSGREVATVAAYWPGGTFVVPGIRPPGSGTGDQKRVVTPRQALEAGASVLVVGRPITDAADPAEAARAIAGTLQLDSAAT